MDRAESIMARPQSVWVAILRSHNRLLQACLRPAGVDGAREASVNSIATMENVGLCTSYCSSMGG